MKSLLIILLAVVAASALQANIDVKPVGSNDGVVRDYPFLGYGLLGARPQYPSYQGYPYAVYGSHPSQIKPVYGSDSGVVGDKGKEVESERVKRSPVTVSQSKSGYYGYYPRGYTTYGYPGYSNSQATKGSYYNRGKRAAEFPALGSVAEGSEGIVYFTLPEGIDVTGASGMVGGYQSIRPVTDGISGYGFSTVDSLQPVVSVPRE